MIIAILAFALVAYIAISDLRDANPYGIPPAR